jgi:hypothetical protein
LSSTRARLAYYLPQAAAPALIFFWVVATQASDMAAIRPVRQATEAVLGVAFPNFRSKACRRRADPMAALGRRGARNRVYVFPPAVLEASASAAAADIMAEAVGAVPQAAFRGRAAFHM